MNTKLEKITGYDCKWCGEHITGGESVNKVCPKCELKLRFGVSKKRKRFGRVTKA